MFISQVFILSPRGDKLVFKDYRQDAPRNADELFFRKYMFWDGAQRHAPEGDCPPFFIEKHVNFCYVKRRELLFVCTSMVNVSPSLTLEILLRIIKVIKDYLGVLSEESIRMNFTLVYELLDEMLDVGVPQELNAERLRPYIFNEVALVANPDAPTRNSFLERLRRGEFLERTRRGDAALNSILKASSDRKNEIFIDILERLNVVFDSAGQVVLSVVDGAIVMKSFLAGTPSLHLHLNEDLVVGRGDAGRERYASVVLDSVSFHEDADYSGFERERQLSIRPPEGEFTLMNYGLSGKGTPPFRLVHAIELLSSHRAEMTLQIRADLPVSTHGIAVRVSVPMPLTCTAASVELCSGATEQTYDYKEEAKCVAWSIAKFPGGTEQVCKIRFSTSSPITAATRRGIGPISMQFEIPHYSASGLCIRVLRLEERSSSYNPARWIRNATLANSYVFRIH
ncbi:putative mu-adaptin 4, putative,adaptor complex AP-4 medium subunit [Trypanosoma rangeli]|uniref:Putative mu-adaptin 4, putative,adaptor complex AP-4 medium subunit n=1 Tax=Trypanosoma rangeli TaxID=5698 RepID=A0A3R7NKK1_TRYRA|nr:putative mu-adaptin 4, putative,adaptor complex AP-4 medium subunit [Trypanosoma rangeli]RNF04016.1 putative mu-adaptin 4, putative,adaptor complex AP-4 medium subunit [Trypanosoma rangeli]|eukprot:RNF04016.1 putative mu-adaptin 4, putative,adaptor complex AP-4 medium subunit [Trypanosoma rangeli]